MEVVDCHSEQELALKEIRGEDAEKGVHLVTEEETMGKQEADDETVVSQMEESRMESGVEEDESRLFPYRSSKPSKHCSVISSIVTHTTHTSAQINIKQSNWYPFFSSKTLKTENTTCVMPLPRHNKPTLALCIYSGKWLDIALGIQNSVRSSLM